MILVQYGDIHLLFVGFGMALHLLFHKSSFIRISWLYASIVTCFTMVVLISCTEVLYAISSPCFIDSLK